MSFPYPFFNATLKSGSARTYLQVHRYWRIYITNYNGGTAPLSELEFYLSGVEISTAGGTGSASSTAFGSVANAFDGVEGGSNYWHPTSGVLPQWLQMDFGAGNEKAVDSISIMFRQDFTGQGPRDFNIQYSDDGINWTTSWSVIGQGWSATKVSFPRGF